MFEEASAVKETVIIKRDVELRAPVFVEGLPGLGSVGAIAVNYAIHTLGAEKFGDLYSPHFPFHAVTDDDGQIRLLRNELHYWRNPAPDGSDIVLVSGDCQAQTPEGQYEVASTLLDAAEEMGSKLFITLGGYSGQPDSDEPKVVAASTSTRLLDQLKGTGVEASPPGNPIVGAAGIIVALSRLRGLTAVCFLGETKGYIPDPRAARSVLKQLSKLLGIDIDVVGLEAEIRRIERLMEQVNGPEMKRSELGRRVGRTTYIS